MAPRGLATKFSLVVALVVVVSIGAMSLLAVSMSRRSLRDQALAANLTAATLAARAIEQYLVDAVSVMREAPGRPKLGQEVRSGNWPEAGRVLENFLRHFSQFDYVFVQDPHGVIRVRVPHAATVGQDFAFREFFQDVMRTRALSISDVYASQAAQRPVVSIAVPVLEGETVKGVLVGALSLRTMGEVVSAIGKDDAAQLSLVDRKGALIARSNGARVDLGRDLTALPIVRTVLAGKAGTMEFTASGGSEAFLGAFVPIARAGWGMVATKPASVAFAPAERLARWLLGIALGCAALAVVLGWRLARTLTRPIGRLATATDQLATGHFDVRVVPEGRDEVAALAVSFNRMAEQLQTSYQSLERKTKEVEAINEELVGEITERRQAEEEVSRLNRDLQEQLEELQRTQAQLVQSEKLATLGNLLAGVAHELNNPLSVVLGHAMLLGKRAEAGVADRARKIAQAAERCARIVKSFLALARQHPPERKRVELNAVVEEALELLAYHLRVENVEVVRDLAGDVPALWADIHQLHQVVVNLVTNAVHAMRQVPGARRLTVRTRYDAVAGHARLEVADTGPGIPPEIQARIFEPFFTTKPPGEGTGLGLALCQGIVDGHGGHIGLETELGLGTVFRIDLPILTPPGVEAPGPESAGPSVRGRAILVVDDERDVADVLAEMLGDDGHRVETVGSGAQALDRLRERTYDLIISDVRMPGLDGPALAREIERRHPALLSRLIFLTGDTLTPHIREFLRAAGRPEIAKPFDLADIRRVVQDVLRGQERVT